MTRYDFLLSGEAFVTFYNNLENVCSANPIVIRKIAEQTQGDTWAAWNELSKCAAGGSLGIDREELSSVYELADACKRVLRGERVCKSDANKSGDASF